MSKFNNREILSAVLRTIVSEISDDKELTNQFNLVKSVVGDINRAKQLNLYLAGAVAAAAAAERPVLNREEHETQDLTQETDVSEFRDVSKLDHIYSEPPPDTGLDAEDNYSGNFILSMCADLDFEVHFGVNRTTVEAILQKMNNHYFRFHIRRPSLPMETKLLLTLWMLTTQDTYRSVSERFKLNKGNCHWLFFDTCELLYSAVSESIFWPEQSEWTRLQSTFKSITGMPGVISVIGSCHIPITLTCNPDSKELFTNNRGYPSVVVQAICRPDLKFTDVSIGWPGSMSCEQIFRNSDIYSGISTHSDAFLPENGHITGNAAFPLESFLLTPYRGHLDEFQTIYNAALSRCWFILRKSFSLLHGRFKRLQCVDMARKDALPKMIAACFVLHNMILMEEEEVPDVDVRDDNIHYVEFGVTDDGSNPLAESKRESIAKAIINQSNYFC